MESPELLQPLTTEKELSENEQDELFKYKEYELKINNEKFIFSLKINPEDKILFQAKNINNLLLKFEKEYSYKELIKTFLLIKDYYNNINKIFTFLDISLTKNKISLLYDKDKTIIKLKLKKQLDYDEINCFLYLKLNKGPKEKIDNFIESNNDYKIFYESIKKENEEIKANMELIKKENDELKTNVEIFKKDNEKIKNNMESIKKENEELKNNMELIKKDYEELENNYKSLLKKIKMFTGDYDNDKDDDIEIEQFDKLKKYSIPLRFEYVERFGYSDEIVYFDVYNRLKDNAQYLIYSIVEKDKKWEEDKKIKYINKIYIMMMANNENKIIKEINQNFTQIFDTKYYSKNDNEEYLFVSGEFLQESYFFLSRYYIRIIAFDIQNNYNEKIIIDINDYYICNSTLFLFNILSKNYILVSYKEMKFSKLYDY